MSFKIFLIYHSHIDIGYTERQERITNYQADFIRQAVDCVLSEKQKNRSDKEKFKFTAEGFWAVEQYLLKYGDAGRERLLKAIRTKCFELSATYLHNAELLDYNTYDWSIKRGTAFAKENGLGNLPVAMSVDVNGLSVGYAESLCNNGVKYYCTNINTHHGGTPFAKPLVPFYWQTPDGNKLLVWNGLTYHKGNLLGLIPGLMAIGGAGIPGMLDTFAGFRNIKTVKQVANRRIHSMVKGFKKIGYPYDFAPIMAGGCYTDNNPLGDAHCDMVKEWNKLYGDDIEIVTSTLEEFFTYMQSHITDIPTFSGEWNDWWTDGVLSTPNETNFYRKAARLQRKILATDGYDKVISTSEMNNLNYNLAMFSEHTWGHSQSLTDPCKLIVRQLDVRKGDLAIKAYAIAGELYSRLTSKITKSLPLERNEIGLTNTVEKCFDESKMEFSNDFYSISFDKSGIKSLITDTESLLNNDTVKLGQPVYQVFPNGNRGVCAGFGYGKRGKLPQEIHYGNVKKLSVIKNNVDSCSVRIEYDIKGTSIFNTIVTMYRNSAKIGIKTQMLKDLVLDPEGMYVAFPLNTNGGEWYLDKAKYLSKVGEQLPKTCCDYFSCVRGVMLKGAKESICINMYGSPLVMIGGLKLWEFTTDINPSGTLYSWLTNNKWETNFRCECSGIIENCYDIEICDANNELNILKKNDLSDSD